MGLLQSITTFFSKKQNLHKDIKSIFGFTPNNIDLFYEALAHKSHNKGNGIDNERLEFLGDTVLDLVVANLLYNEFPEVDEGELTKLKSKIVSREHLLSLSNAMELSDKLHIKKQKSLPMDNIIGNVIEAIFGAIFLDQGYDKTNDIICEVMDDYVNLHQLKDKVVDFKSKVHEWAQSEKKKIRFQTVSIGNLENTKYRSDLYIDDVLKAKGIARNKKIAQRKASESMWNQILLSEGRNNA